MPSRYYAYARKGPKYLYTATTTMTIYYNRVRTANNESYSKVYVQAQCIYHNMSLYNAHTIFYIVQSSRTYNMVTIHKHIQYYMYTSKQYTYTFRYTAAARPRDMSMYIPMAEHLQVLNNTTTRSYWNKTYYDNIIIIIPRNVTLRSYLCVVRPINPIRWNTTIYLS